MQHFSPGSQDNSLARDRCYFENSGSDNGDNRVSPAEWAEMIFNLSGPPKLEKAPDTHMLKGKYVEKVAGKAMKKLREEIRKRFY